MPNVLDTRHSILYDYEKLSLPQTDNPYTAIYILSTGNYSKYLLFPLPCIRIRVCVLDIVPLTTFLSVHKNFRNLLLIVY